MSINKPQHRRVSIVIAELFKAQKNQRGTYVTKKGASKTLTLYDVSPDEVYNMIRFLFGDEMEKSILKRKLLATQ